MILGGRGQGYEHDPVSVQQENMFGILSTETSACATTKMFFIKDRGKEEK